MDGCIADDSDPGVGALHDTRPVFVSMKESRLSALLSKPDTGRVGDPQSHGFGLCTTVTYIRTLCALCNLLWTTKTS
jgi:hypothetical protein